MNNNTPTSIAAFKGTGVALVTPFNEDASVDYNSLEKIINHVIEGGLEYVVSLGTTGESATLSKEEKAAVLAFTVEKTNGRMPVVAGFGGNNTQAIVNDLQHADLSEVAAILSVSPYYNKPNQKGIIAHYQTIADASPKPIILYNVPGRTSSNLLASTTLTLAQHPNIIAIKEASGDLPQCMEIVHNRPNKDFLVVSGDDILTLPMLSFGMDGVISVVANAFPRQFSDMVRAGLAGDFKTASSLHFQLMNIINLLFADGNPGGVKAALNILGICSEKLRQPLHPINDQVRQELNKAIQALPL